MQNKSFTKLEKELFELKNLVKNQDLKIEELAQTIVKDRKSVV